MNPNISEFPWHDVALRAKNNYGGWTTSDEAMAHIATAIEETAKDMEATAMANHQEKRLILDEMMEAIK